MALSFHSVFEGLAIGLQESLSQLISLFLAVIAHKGNFYYLSELIHSEKASKIWKLINYQKNSIFSIEKKGGKYKRNFNLLYGTIYLATHLTNM